MLFSFNSAADGNNRCESKFSDHSAQAEDVMTRYNLCKQNRWSFWGINGISWGNYFDCFDNLAPHRAQNPNFFRECLYSDQNSWARSTDLNRCISTIKALDESNNASACFNPRIGREIISEKFDSCVATATDLGFSARAMIDTCSQSFGRVKIKCVEEIAPVYGAKKSWAYCQDYNLRQSLNDGEFLPCIAKSEELSVSEAVAVNICSQRDSEETFACMQKNEERFDQSILADKCSSSDFRRANNDKNFDVCLDNSVADGLNQEEALGLCVQDADTIELFAFSNEFKQCKDKVIERYGFSVKNAYTSCSDKEVMAEIDNKKFMGCFERGLSSGTLGYFGHRAKELEGRGFSLFNQRDNNPYYYVIQNCFSDLKYQSYKKQNRYLDFYRDYNIHSRTVFEKENTLLGGLSALSFDAASKKMYLLSDDKGQYGAPRIYVYDYDFEDEKLRLEEDRLISFRKSENDLKSTYAGQMDPEGLGLGSDGDIIISSEIANLSNNNAVTIFSKKGVKKGNILISDDFLSSRGMGPKGIQFNKGLESLSVSPDKENLFIANEASLRQDIKLNTKDGNCRFRSCVINVGDVIRIVKYSNTDTGFEEQGQYYYRMDDEVDNGVSEILSIDENNMLVLERSWDNHKRKITSKIYHVNMAGHPFIPRESAQPTEAEEEETEEVIIPEVSDDNRPSTGFGSMVISETVIQPGQRTGTSGRIIYRSDNHYSDRPINGYRPYEKPSERTWPKKDADSIKDLVLEKTLILDFDDVTDQLSPGFRRLENFEGLAFGPVLPNGSPSLAVVADNNFSLGQRSLLLLFEILPGAFEGLGK